MAILREYLIDKIPVSEVCDKHGVQADEVWSNVVDAAGSGGLFFLSVGERDTADHIG